MSAAKVDQRRRAEALHEEGLSQRDIARELGISRTRVQQLLEDTPGDRLHEELLSSSSLPLLVRHERVLVERIRRDLRHLRATREEIQCRRDDEVLGLTLSTGRPGATMPPCSRPARAPRVPSA